MELDKVSEG